MAIGKWFKDNRTPMAICFGIVGSICSILGFLSAAFQKPPAWVLAGSYFLFAISLIVLLGYEMRRRLLTATSLEIVKANLASAEKKLTEKETQLNTYHQAIEIMHTIFHKLRDDHVDITTQVLTDDRLTEHVRNLVIDILTKTVSMFHLLFRKNCAASVKLFIEAPSENDFDPLITFARDIASAVKRGDKDSTERYNVLRNSDFHKIMHTPDKWFYSADLTQERLYANERTNWQKLYKCTAVLPIMKTRQTSKGKVFQDIVGFYCLDSNEPDAFPEQQAVEILACITDTLYTTLHYYQEELQRRNTLAQNN